MYPQRPDIDEYVRHLDNLADFKDDLAKFEYELSKKIANCIKTAMDGGSKTRMIDVVKVVGNNIQDEKEIDDLKEKIRATNKKIGMTWAKIEAWRANKDIYISDSYHQVKGRGKYYDVDEEES